MKSIFKKSVYLLTVAAIAFSFASCKKEDPVVYEVLNLENKLNEAETEWLGDESGVETEGTYLNQFSCSNNFYQFDNYYTPAWGSWGGFIYTNKTDVTTPGYTNNSAITGKGVNGKVYLTAFISDFNAPVVSFTDGKDREVEGLYITNSTYTYLSIKNGDDFSKKFEEGDWFKLEIYGKDTSGAETGKVELYLADFRDGKTEILNSWKWIPLKELGEMKSIHFALSSTDNGEYGMNTPAYVCVDGIKAVKQ